ncbi:universal stress protein [Akkermansiaceae bacterium]|nr:universal stress protein [Akkermansiaceae bacterium]
MNETKKKPMIVAGIDFSDSSPVVLRHALHAASACGGSVVAVHVLDKSMREHREASGHGNPGFEALREQAESRFARLPGVKDGTVDLSFTVSIGKPAVEMAALAADLGADFLVIAANDLTKKRLGSVAARCLRMAPCDVLVLRDWQGGDFRKIVVCTDFSATADRAIRRAAAMAGRSGAALEIVNVIFPPGLDSWGGVLEHAADAPESYEEECRAAAKARMAACLKKHSAILEGVRHEAVILESEMPSVKITGHVSSCGADLVVMGTHGQSPIMSHFIGTNAERLIQDAPVSVFAVR